MEAGKPEPVTGGRSHRSPGRLCATLALFLLPAALPAAPAPAFPGCAGWGCETPGGRGGRIVWVESLADSGPGTLRAALEERGPRTVLFRVAGVIHLESPIFLGGLPGRGSGEEASFVTVAGHSAPGEGVTVADYGLILTNGVHDVVIRHLRFRNSQRDVGERRGEPGRGVERPGRQRPGMEGAPRERRRPPSGEERERRRRQRARPGEPGFRPRSTGDGIDLLGARRVVVDHCSFSWATDENFSAERFDNADVTVSRSVLAEVLWRGGHEGRGGGPREHSRGMNLSRGADRISIHHNLFISNNWRNPHLVGCSGQGDRCRPEWPEHPVFDVRCNVIYNWGEKALHAAGGARVNAVDNLFVRGPDTATGSLPIVVEDRDPSWDTRLWVEGNVDSALGSRQEALTGARVGSLRPAEAPFDAPPVERCVAGELRERAAGWGARPPGPVDRRLFEELASGRGSVGARERTHATPVPAPAVAEAPPDADRDGLPDAWERARGLDPADPGDSWRDPDGNGWSHLEEYLEGVDSGRASEVDDG